MTPENKVHWHHIVVSKNRRRMLEKLWEFLSNMLMKTVQSNVVNRPDHIREVPMPPVPTIKLTGTAQRRPFVGWPPYIEIFVG